MPAIECESAVFAKLSTSTVKTGGTDSSDADAKNNNTKISFGTFTWPSGASYKGQFHDGQRNGEGVQTWPDGSSYEGNFLNDLRHGFGIHHWTSGEVQ